MRKLLFVAMASIAIVSCKKEGETAQASPEVATQVKKENKPVADTKKATMKIEGMTCAMGCAKTIENKLAGLDGVQKATVDFDAETASIEYDGAVQSIESLSKTIEGVADGKTYKVSDAKNM
ncbi:heavy-metal-associated domain-containing protein [Flavobacterium sp. H122]|uniref:heavy-metal-associated domain-containing protein n=1 Tax=Flavobacterium sp. H122 TaxID=2529860 RepID=UPI0010AA3981|nr:heavy metal-associated domain-containing protein [Flavobacterium sp. H122]